MTTNAKQPPIPQIIHIPTNHPDTIAVVHHNPTAAFNPATRSIHSIDFSQPQYQFIPRNNAIKFEVNQYGVVIVSLNRPKKMNAMDLGMVEDLYDVIQWLIKRQQFFRAVVLSSTTPTFFCAGLDILSTMNTPGAMELLLSPHDPSYETYADAKRITMIKLQQRDNNFHGSHNIVQHVCVGWQLLNLPVIALVNGIAIGAGFQLIMGADIRIMTETSQISILEAKWGLIPDMGITSTTRNIIPEDKLKLLTFTSQFVTTNELKDYNIATILCSDIDSAYAKLNSTVNSIIFKTPPSIASGKLLYNTTNEHKYFLYPSPPKITKKQKKEMKKNQKAEHDELMNKNFQQGHQQPSQMFKQDRRTNDNDDDDDDDEENPKITILNREKHYQNFLLFKNNTNLKILIEANQKMKLPVFLIAEMPTFEQQQAMSEQKAEHEMEEGDAKAKILQAKM